MLYLLFKGTKPFQDKALYISILPVICTVALGFLYVGMAYINNIRQNFSMGLSFSEFSNLVLKIEYNGLWLCNTKLTLIEMRQNYHPLFICFCRLFKYSQILIHQIDICMKNVFKTGSRKTWQINIQAYLYWTKYAKKNWIVPWNN